MYCPSAHTFKAASTSGKSTSTQLKQSCTLGVELEFVAVVPDQSEFTAHDTVWEVLRKPISLPCPYNCPQGHHELRLPIDNQPPSYWQHRDDDNEYNTWVVGRDCSVRLSDDEKPFYPNESVSSDVELQCRILDFFNPTPCPHNQAWPCNGQPLTWNWGDEITTVINALKQGFNRPGFRVFANGTCGLHLHVGRHDLGFNLDTTKNIMGMFTALERCFDAILPVDRIGAYEDDRFPLPSLISASTTAIQPWIPSKGFNYTSPMSVRQFESLANSVMIAYDKSDVSDFTNAVRYGASIPMWIHHIYSCRTMAELCEYSHPHQSSVNLQHLAPQNNSPGGWPGSLPKKTIEFRLHSGTLDVVEICAWIDLLCRLTVYCENTSTTTLTAWIETQWDNADVTLVDIARLVNAADSTVRHYTSVLLTPDYATNFFNTATTSQAPDILTPLTTQVESTRLSQTCRSGISARITQKLISGRYGQFPNSFLKKVLPAELLEGNDGRYLSNEMEEEQMEAWASEIEERARFAIDERQRWDSRRGASTCLNNLFD
ncbi:hypothetical protein D6D28_09283 [Aureobasidium pullulans]|uniref:Amidoligase enzyme n=1 Tax=Aureobasidium pullulans TaxID=5580 RepID=A0A4S8S4Y6_AURPU|nr:hypothetical protein D6D28_09283 [Aureobasidium pullulans]